MSYLRLFVIALAGTTASSVLACGGGAESSTSSGTSSGGTSSSSTPAGSCEGAGVAICARACACSTDGKCHISVGADSGMATVDFADNQACRDTYVTFGCAGGGKPGFDYAACETSAQAAACVDAAGGKAVAFPSACRTN